MKISTKTRYGVRALIELTHYYPDTLVSLKEVSKSQCLSEKYLEQIFATLRNIGLVVAVRGMSGGYKLAYPPEKIRLLDVYTALEGPPCLVECQECPNTEHFFANCPTRGIWAELSKVISTYMADKTLQDIYNEQKKSAGSLAAR